MIQRLDPDKTRFIDLAAEGSPYYVHSIDLSDHRAEAHYITLWVKASNCPKIKQWAAECGLDPDLHSPAKFHLDDDEVSKSGNPAFGWIAETFPGVHPGHWRTHYHVLTDTAPRAAFLIPFRDQIPPALFEEIANG